MLIVISALKGFAVEASDGRIGVVNDFLFDDLTWKLRWLVVDTGTWLTERKILVHPSAIGKADYEGEILPVRLTKAQIEGSPLIREDQPVSRQMETRLHEYYGSDPIWGYSYFGTGALAAPLSTSTSFGAGMASAAIDEPARDSGDPHLRSTAAVKGYHVHASDGEIGHVENFLVEDASWDIRYLIIDTKNWWPGKHVLMSPYAVREVSLPDREVCLDVDREKVKSSPPWDPIAMIDQVYEKRLHSHYGWLGYGF